MSTLLVNSRIRSAARISSSLPLHRLTGLRAVRLHSSTPPPPSAPTHKSQPTPTQLLAPSSRLAQSYPRLVQLSARTGVPLPSLGISFLILHELTAIVPVVLLFWLFQSIGLGVGLLSWIKGAADVDEQTDVSYTGGAVVDNSAGGAEDLPAHAAGWKGVLRGWYDEAELKVERVGRRYGILGYERPDSSSTAPSVDSSTTEVQSGAPLDVATTQRARSSTAAESVANAISAYVVVKVCLLCSALWLPSGHTPLIRH